jgi:hypothetical protein
LSDEGLVCAACRLQGELEAKAEAATEKELKKVKSDLKELWKLLKFFKVCSL